MKVSESVAIMMLSQENRILTSAIPNSLVKLETKDSSYLLKHSHFADSRPIGIKGISEKTQSELLTGRVKAKI